MYLREKSTLCPLHLAYKRHALCMAVLYGTSISVLPDLQWAGLGQQHAAVAAQGGIPGGGGGGHDLGPSSGKGHGFLPQQNRKKSGTPAFIFSVPNPAFSNIFRSKSRVL
jgi:hypothetical protein